MTLHPAHVFTLLWGLSPPQIATSILGLSYTLHPASPLGILRHRWPGVASQSRSLEPFFVPKFLEPTASKIHNYTAIPGSYFSKSVYIHIIVYIHCIVRSHALGVVCTMRKCPAGFVFDVSSILHMIMRRTFLVHRCTCSHLAQ